MKGIPVKARVPLIFLAAATLTLTACGGGGGDSEAGDNELGLVEAGSLTVCSDIPYAPFEFEEGGEYTGFDIDLIREVAKGMDLELSIKDVGFDGLQSGASLAAGQCDLGASAMSITEDRKKNLTFSDPYYDSQQSLMVPKDSDIKSIEELEGKTVGVQQGTTGEDYTRENVPESTEVKAYPSDAELFPALQSGGVDAVLQDLPVNILHTEDGAFTIVEEYPTDEQYGFAMKKEGSEKLAEAVNESLAEVKDKGTYDEIYNKYFKE
ncbi:basic amino acid ABC transporter substrate-binding protein [Arthrobacter roseus]